MMISLSIIVSMMVVVVVVATTTTTMTMIFPIGTRSRNIFLTEYGSLTLKSGGAISQVVLFS